MNETAPVSEVEMAWMEQNPATHDVPRLLAEVKKLRSALTPSAETKAAFIGEFQFAIDSDMDDSMVTVPWTTVKEIMAAIRALAARDEGETK